MKKFVATFLACFAAAALSPAAAQASPAFPTILGASQADTVNLEQVRSHRYRHRHRHRHRHYRRGINPGAAAAAGIIGLGIGAAIASQPRHNDRDWDAYCFSKYKSYDPRTGTYLGYDGYRHECR